MTVAHYIETNRIWFSERPREFRASLRAPSGCTLLDPDSAMLKWPPREKIASYECLYTIGPTGRGEILTLSNWADSLDRLSELQLRVQGIQPSLET